MHEVIKYGIIAAALFACCYIVFGLFIWVLHGILGFLQPLIKIAFIICLIGAVVWFIGDPNGFTQTATKGINQAKAFIHDF